VKRRAGGQVLVMTTLALFAMCGLIGLAVDLGWSFFVKRSAQAAADTAASAAAEEVLAAVGGAGTFSCGAVVICQVVTPCPSTLASPPANNIELGCAYAQRNGFEVGGNSGRQNVTVESNAPPPSCGSSSPPDCVPTAPGVAASYWVTVRVTETVPQLFSAVLGNATAVVSARATAAIVESVVSGSLILLNRQTDPSPELGPGVNLAGGGNPIVTAPGGIILASNCGGANCGGTEAGHLQGTAGVTAPFTYVRTGGVACAGNIPGCSQVGGSTWISPYTNRSDGSMFYDPMRGKGQPPLTNQVLPDRPVMGGAIMGGTAANPTVLLPGNYYATRTVGCGKGCSQIVASGIPITLGGGYFRFDPSGSLFTDWTYIFWGGARTGGGNTTINFHPGSYVFAGQVAGEGEPLIFLSNGTTLEDRTPGFGQNTDAGELLIFTNGYYPGLDTQAASLPLVSNIRPQFLWGSAGFTMGNNDASSINLHGVNDQNPLIQGTPLAAFSPVIAWQDQGNSSVQYTSNGYIKYTDCGGPGGGGLDSPCLNLPQNSMSRAMNLQATPNTHLFGAVYQPRGAWVNLQGGGGYAGPLQLISGAINLQGGPNVTLLSPPNPLTTKVVALVA